MGRRDGGMESVCSSGGRKGNFGCQSKNPNMQLCVNGVTLFPH